MDPIENELRGDKPNWYEDDAEQETEEYPIDQYDLSAAPNDFNVLTIFNFIESGAVKIPGFQRNYVWDVRRASKLIESLIIGLPVPQIFLYEEAINKFLVIDGQQRLMSIYYFMKQRFPRREKRAELRRIFDEHGRVPDEILQNDDYFATFNLHLPQSLSNQPNKFTGMSYSTLGDYKTAVDLRPIRNIIVKQLSPKDDDSAVYEIFNRLNSGGINLTPQEVRMSLYHSDFYAMLYRVNALVGWRRLLGIPDPDLHVKDIEILLRGFAMLIGGEQYNPSMVKFLNGFSKRARHFDSEHVKYFEVLFNSFLRSCEHLDADSFLSSVGRFSVTIFECAFAAICAEAYAKHEEVTGKVQAADLGRLRADAAFLSAAESRTTSKANVTKRLARARELVHTI
jgi:hypothetical protein